MQASIVIYGGSCLRHGLKTVDTSEITSWTVYTSEEEAVLTVLPHSKFAMGT